MTPYTVRGALGRQTRSRPDAHPSHGIALAPLYGSGVRAFGHGCSATCRGNCDPTGKAPRMLSYRGRLGYGRREHTMRQHEVQDVMTEAAGGTHRRWAWAG